MRIDKSLLMIILLFSFMAKGLLAVFFSINNQSNSTIDIYYIKENFSESIRIVRPGQSLTITDIRPKTYLFIYRHCNDQFIDEYFMKQSYNVTFDPRMQN